VTHQTHRQFFLISLMPRFDGGDDFMLVGESSEHMFQFEVKIWELSPTLGLRSLQKFQND
jgi:hypothetical protein